MKAVNRSSPRRSSDPMLVDPARVRNLKLNHPPHEATRAAANSVTRKWPIVLVLMLAAGAVLFWRTKQPANVRQIAARNETTAVATPAAPSVFTAAGYLEPIPPYPLTVSALVSGRVDEFDVLEGTPVKAGDVLAKLNCEFQQKRIVALQAELGVNAEKVALAEQVLARIGKLAAGGSAPARELDDAKAAAAIARAEQRRLQAAVDLAKWQIESAVVRAPVDGVVFERLAQPGEFVSPEALNKKDAAIVTLYNPEKIQAWVDVTQRDAGRVRIGQRAEISLDAEPGKTYVGRVIRIQPRASLQKNTVQVKVAIENPSPMLRPDMSAKVSFLPGETQRANASQP